MYPMHTSQAGYALGAPFRRLVTTDHELEFRSKGPMSLTALGGAAS